MDNSTMEALLYAALAGKSSGGGGGGVPSYLVNQVNQNTSAINTLNGTGAGSVDKKVADAIAALVANAPDDLDTLAEIADYIAADKTGAAQMLAQISANTQAIEGIDNDLAQIGTDMDALQEAIEHAFDNLTPEQKAQIKGDKGDPGPPGPKGDPGEGGGTSDYEALENIPTIEARQVIGNKSAEELNLASRTYVDTQLGNVEALLETI